MCFDQACCNYPTKVISTITITSVCKIMINNYNYFSITTVRVGLELGDILVLLIICDI